jgi:hypothetical protein
MSMLDQPQNEYQTLNTAPIRLTKLIPNTVTPVKRLSLIQERLNATFPAKQNAIKVNMHNNTHPVTLFNVIALISC